MNWYIGQKVVAKTPHSLRFYGSGVLTVNEVVVCSCGCVHLTINERPGVPGGLFFCSDCPNLIKQTSYMGTKSTHFRPVIEDYTEEEIESVNIDELIEELCEPA